MISHDIRPAAAAAGTRQHGRPDGSFIRVGLALAFIALPLVSPMPAAAQFFSDRAAPPVPPGSVPEAPPPAPALNLAPPGDVAPPPVSPPQAAIVPFNPAPPPAAAAPAPPTAAQGVLSLSAKFGKDLPAITSGVIWRVYADRPDPTGAFRLIREDRGATPNIVLPPGSYVVHASLGLVSAARPVTIRQETSREAFELPAGGLRIEGRVGSSKIPPGQVTFSIYKGSQFDTSISERAPVAQNVPAGDVALVPEGTYYIVSTYGEANSVVRSDIRVAASKLTDVTVTHRAAIIMLKLVSERGGEALANTAWSVLTPAGDVINESLGAFPRVVLAEGEYRVIARNEGHMFERTVNVVNGVDSEVEVLAK